MIRVIQALIRLIPSITARKHVHNRQQQKNQRPLHTDMDKLNDDDQCICK